MAIESVDYQSPSAEFQSVDDIDALLVAASDDTRSMYAVLETYDPDGLNNQGPPPAEPNPAMSAMTPELEPLVLDEFAVLQTLIDQVNNIKIRLRELIVAIG